MESVFINHDESGLHYDFGPWAQVFFGEFDGKQNKIVLVKIIGSYGVGVRVSKCMSTGKGM
jgi:hypothetical protein